MKKTSNYKMKLMIAGVAVLLLIVFGYLYMQATRPAPYEPGKMIETTGVALDGNAGE